jgi:hypothetical protein
VFALAGALCGCSPLLPFLPGGATCRDNPEQAKTVPKAAPQQAVWKRGLRLGRLHVEESDHRRRLLRASRERPRHRAA